jgi:DNA-binding NtrC family response regulator
MNPRIQLFLVDDDAVFLKSLQIDFLQLTNCDITTFDSGERCLANISVIPDIVILDYHLDGINPTAMNGLQTLNAIKAFNAAIPVIMLSSQDKIEVAINCMHHYASDYVVKSETAFLRLQKIITAIFKQQKLEKQLKWYVDRM